MSEFDFGYRDKDRPRRGESNLPAAWFAHATATFAGVFFAGLLLLLLVRWYVVESLRNVLAEPQEKIKNSR